MKDVWIDVLKGIIKSRRIQPNSRVKQTKIGQTVLLSFGFCMGQGELGPVTQEGCGGDLFGRQSSIGGYGFIYGQGDLVFPVQMQIRLLDLPCAV